MKLLIAIVFIVPLLLITRIMTIAACFAELLLNLSEDAHYWCKCILIRYIHDTVD